MTDKMKSAKAATVFSDDEKSAMKERAREEKAARAGADGEKEVLAKIAEMTGTDRELAERIHAIVKASAPTLTSKTCAHTTVCPSRLTVLSEIRAQRVERRSRPELSLAAVKPRPRAVELGYGALGAIVMFG